MKITMSKLTGIICLTLLFSMSLISCKKDDDNNSGNASTEFRITDSPIDDASVSGAFVTITDIKLDGVSLQGFTKTTVDIAAYQNGSTKTLGNFNLEGKTYNTVTFVLDYNTDASGNAPGSYILTTGGAKHKLESSSNVITVTKNITLQSGTSNTVTADFDLRKMIVHQSGSASDQFDFATTAELQSAVRVVTNNSATISGTLTDAVSGSAKVVAYAYKQGLLTGQRRCRHRVQAVSSLRMQ